MYKKRLSLLLVMVLILSTFASPVTLQAQSETEDEAITEQMVESGANGIAEDPATKFMYSDRGNNGDIEEVIELDRENPFGAEKSREIRNKSLSQANMYERASLQTLVFDQPGDIAYSHVEYLSENIGQRVAQTLKKPNQKSNGNSGEEKARAYIEDVLEDFYSVEIQPFTAELCDSDNKLQVT